MLGVVEHIQKIARTDRRIKKILTGCIRVTETANHDGDVEFLLLELKWWCRFSLATRHTSIELRQLSDYSLLYSMLEDTTHFKIMTDSVGFLRNTLLKRYELSQCSYAMRARNTANHRHTEGKRRDTCTARSARWKSLYIFISSRTIVSACVTILCVSL